MKTIVGYVREHPSGQPVPNVNVTVRTDDVAGTVIPPGGMYMAGTNPIVTDTKGMFSWQTELSPGPIRIEADILTGQDLKVRSGREVMQAGDVFISDMDMYMRLFSPGVFPDIGEEFGVNEITGQMQVRVRTGAANMLGILFQTHTERILTIDPNTTLSHRVDLVVLEQYLTGDSAGKQYISVIKGTVAGIAPDTNLDPSVFQLPICAVDTPQNATSVTLTPVQVFSAPSRINLESGSIILDYLNPEVLAYISTTWPGLAIKKSDGNNLSTGAKSIKLGTGLSGAVAGTEVTINSLDTIAKLNDTQISTPSAGQVLTFSGSKWQNKPIPPVVIPSWSVASLTDTTISSPATGQVLTYSGGKWINKAPAAGGEKYFDDANFDGGYYTGSNRKLASVAITVDPGTYILETMTIISVNGNGGPGGCNIWLGGSGVPTGSNASARVFETDGYNSRLTTLTGRVIVRPSVRTTYTADAWIAHQFGSNALIGSGTLFITAK